jgi:nucleotidyltransferase substrate binding protein (TIGR01987 family)
MFSAECRTKLGIIRRQLRFYLGYFYCNKTSIIINEAAEKGIISDINPWIVYREQRNIISHTYDENKAEAVRQTAYEFLKDAKILLTKLMQRTS